MQVYLVVEIHEDGRVDPSVGVISTSTSGAYMASSGAIPQQANLDTVRLGTRITGEVLDFAESIKREAWETAA